MVTYAYGAMLRDTGFKIARLLRIIVMLPRVPADLRLMGSCVKDTSMEDAISSIRLIIRALVSSMLLVQFLYLLILNHMILVMMIPMIPVIVMIMLLSILIVIRRAIPFINRLLIHSMIVFYPMIQLMVMWSPRRRPGTSNQFLN